MTRWPTALLLLAATFVGDLGVDAISVPLRGHRRSGKWWEKLGGVLQPQRRGVSGIVDLQNAGDLQYYTNITLEGVPFRVLVDSGSADLWVAGNVPGSVGNSHNATIRYNDGVVSGQIRTATLGIEGYSIPQQAYISQDVTENYPEGQGILGLGPSRLSSILGTLGDEAGDPPLDRLFKQTTSLPNYISILLGRSNDPDSTIPGQLTIGEVLPDYDAVTSSPQLPIERVDWNQHWMVALDKGGIIGPDGKPIKASVDKQLKVIFDSGYTLPQVPKSVADAIYSRVPSAKYVNISATETPVWTLPCDVELNITFKFAGISYPVHPLDTVMDDLRGPLDDSGKPSCVGSFQPISTDQPYDIVLGMAFLRNAYILMNFGDFVDGALTKVGEPFVQLHSLTDPVEAHEDFIQQRLGGVDTTGLQTLLPSPEQDVSAAAKTSSQKLRQYLPWIIVASVLGGLLLAFLVAYVFIWRSGRKYRRLHEPAPSGLEEGKRSPSLEKEKAPEIAMADKAFPNPWEAEADPLPRKSDVDELMPTRRPFQTRSIYTVTRESSASSMDRLLPGTPGSIMSYETTVEVAPLVSDDRPLPNPYTDIPLTASPPAMDDRPLPNPYTDAPETASPTAMDDMPLPVLPEVQPLRIRSRAGMSDGQPLPSPPIGLTNVSQPASLPPQKERSRPLPDPRAYTTRVGDVIDVSRVRTSTIYKLPPLHFSAAELASSDGGHSSNDARPLPPTS